MGGRALLWMTLLSCAAILVDGSTRANSTLRRDRRHANCPSCISRDCPSRLTSPWYEGGASEDNYGTAYGGGGSRWDRQGPRRSDSWYDGPYSSWQPQHRQQQPRRTRWRGGNANPRSQSTAFLEDTTYDRAAPSFGGEVRGLPPNVAASFATSSLTGESPYGRGRRPNPPSRGRSNPFAIRDPRQTVLTEEDDAAEEDYDEVEDRKALLRRNGDRLASLGNDGSSRRMDRQHLHLDGSALDPRDPRRNVVQNPRNSLNNGPTRASSGRDKIASFKTTSDDSSEASYGSGKAFLPVVQDPRSRNYFLRQEDEESKSDEDQFVYRADGSSDSRENPSTDDDSYSARGLPSNGLIPEQRKYASGPEIEYNPYGISSDLNVFEMLEKISEQLPESAVQPGTPRKQDRGSSVSFDIESQDSEEETMENESDESPDRPGQEIVSLESNSRKSVRAPNSYTPAAAELDKIVAESFTEEEAAAAATTAVTKIPEESMAMAEISIYEGTALNPDLLEDIERPIDTTEPTISIMPIETTSRV